MRDVDLVKLRQWVGRSIESEDAVTGRLVESYRAIFGAALAPIDDVPLALHWCLAPQIAPIADLGLDGHTAKDGFLPPVSLPRRMWAGGEVETLGPLRMGDVVRRRSTIMDIRLKQGRTGQLCFVTIGQELVTPRGLAIRERQELVFRAAVRGDGASGQGTTHSKPSASADLTWRVEASPVLLFRYSALTFNAHRIHYDHPYATETEGYAGLVVHGPLQASLLINMAATLGGSVPRRFAYRGVAPLTAGGSFEVCGARQPDGKAECWIQDYAGRVTTTAMATW